MTSSRQARKRRRRPPTTTTEWQYRIVSPPPRSIHGFPFSVGTIVRLPRKDDGIGTDRRHYHQDMTAVAAEASSATVAKMRSTTADDDSGRSVKATDLWVDVNGVATRVLCWGQSIDDDNRHELKRVVLCVCGNPGITEFYEKFLQEVYRTLNVPVWVLSHAGHEVPPSNSELKIPDSKKYPDLYTLKGQVEHKLRFIEKYVPDNCDLYLVGHSIGSKIISELLKDSAMAQRLSIKRSVFLFPTLQKMRETPNGRKLIFTASNFLSITIFLSWIFIKFPAFIKTFLVNITLMIMEGGQVDDHVIRSAVRLVHPMVLRNVFSMAVDEMDKVYDLDYKPLKDNAKRLHMYFGKTDGWCPTSFYDDISKCVPEAETVLCDKGYQHAYVIGYSDEMAGIVCDWLQPDLEDAKSH